MNTAVGKLPFVYLARHGETDWTISHRHTGLTDLPLTGNGERNADRLGQRLKGLSFDHVFTSPLQRTWRTCELAGYGDVTHMDNDLVEWNYGDYEGQTTGEITRHQPGWELFCSGCPGGESVVDIANRANRVIARLRSLEGISLLFSHGHFLSVLAARWAGLDAAAGRLFFLDTAALSIVGYHHDCDDPVIRLWNDCSHVRES